MEYRVLGRTGLRVSVLGFGCGGIGGLLVRGDENEQRRTVERALEAGVTYFDTAQAYGDGRSEEENEQRGCQGPGGRASQKMARGWTQFLLRGW